MTTCEYCKSENVGHAIGMYFVAYECCNCQHQWIEHFPITTDQEEIKYCNKMNKKNEITN